jgi:regulator of cell morphogenesis and NO signaling
MTPFAIRKRIRAVVAKAGDLARDALATAKTPASILHVASTTPAATPPSAPVATERNWELSSQAELVAHIVSYHHEGLRRDLPAFVGVAKRLEHEQSQHSAVPRGLAETLETMSSELEAHMESEESSLFPLLSSGARRGPIDMQVRMMERDHDDHAKHLELIREQTANLTAPADASAEWTQLYADLVQLEADLRQHIYLEDSILFARAAGSG